MLAIRDSFATLSMANGGSWVGGLCVLRIRYRVLTHSDDKWYCSCAAQYGHSPCTCLHVRAPFNCCHRRQHKWSFARNQSQNENILILHSGIQAAKMLTAAFAFIYASLPFSLIQRHYDFRGWHIWYAVDVESFTVLIFIKRKIPIKSFDIRTRKSQWWFWYAVLD